MMFSSQRYLPPPDDGLQERRIQLVVLVPALTTGDDQASRLEHSQVLGDRLTRRAQPMSGCQPDAQLEKGLAASFVQITEAATRMLSRNLCCPTVSRRHRQ